MKARNSIVKTYIPIEGLINSAYYSFLPKSLAHSISTINWNLTHSLSRKLLKTDVLEAGRHTKIKYWHIGKGDRPTLVFLHGFGDSKEGFFHAAWNLKKNYDLIILDLPGFGESERNISHCHTLSQYSQWLHDFFDHIGIKQFYLAGNSLGGGISAQFAIDFPEMVEKLILIDAAGVVPFKSKSLYDEFLAGVNLFDMKTPQDFDYFMSRVFHYRPFIPLPVKQYLCLQFIKNSRWHSKLIIELLTHGQKEFDHANKNKHDYSTNHLMEKIKVPTLIMWGDQDTFFPVEVAHIMHQLINNSALHIFKDVGHSPQLEVPAKFAKTMHDFLSR